MSALEAFVVPAVPRPLPARFRRFRARIGSISAVGFVLASACSGDDEPDEDSATTQAASSSTSHVESSSESSGDASDGSSDGSGTTGLDDVGELRIEILDPLPDASLMAVPLREPAGYFAAFYDVRAALRGEGGEEIVELVAQSSGPFGGYYYADLVEGPDGRVATFGGMRVGGLHMAGDPPTQYGVRVTPSLSAAPPPAEVVVTVVIPAM
jgi:hypothetical protein